MSNAELAADLVRQADEHMTRRKQLLCAAVALRTTGTIAGARKALAEWNGPPEIRDGAVELINQLAEASATELETAS
ncbi:MAG: hypothetical protein ACRDKL_08480 [Solirubrobacteraceae bacterium]